MKFLLCLLTVTVCFLTGGARTLYWIHEQGESVDFGITEITSPCATLHVLGTDFTRKPTKQSLRFAISNRHGDTLVASLQGVAAYDDATDTPALQLELLYKEEKESHLLKASPSLYSVAGLVGFSLTADMGRGNIWLAGEGNVPRVIWDNTDGKSPLCTKFLTDSQGDSVDLGVRTSCPGDWTPLRASLETEETDGCDTVPPDVLEMYSHASSLSPPAGKWVWLDYDLQDEWLRPGGNYTLYIIPGAEGEWVMVYAEGASVNAGMWTQGRIKGRMQSARMRGHYHVTWFDSEGNPLEGEAVLGQMLTITFPAYGSQIRLIKE